MARRDCTLGDVINLKRGYDLPNQARLDGSVPIVSSSGITGYHAESKVKGPGVITGRYGTLGEIHYVERDFWPLNTTLYVQDFKRNHPRFIAYLLKTMDFGSRSAAAAVPGVNRNDLHMLPVSLPDIQEQHCIASILSAYDDLIENNTRRIAILEEMARRLYEEWFVHFRFPGHEQVRMVESELGLIPEGWQQTTIGKVAANYDRKRKPLSSMQREQFKGPYPYYGAAKIFDYVQDYIFDGRFVLMAEDGSVVTPDGFPMMQLANGKFWANNHTHILQGTALASTEFIYLRLSNEKITGYITGAAQPKITQENMNRIPVILPFSDLMEQFTNLVKPKFDLIDVLVRKNINLCAQHDLLLPKLISGEIDVSAFLEPEAVAA